ncbi:MAG: hypothetical protein RCG15_02105 [Candidatus Rickettsia vulgarisii]
MDEHRNEYFEAAKILGFIDEISPKYQQYDEGWIAGASRIGIWAREIHYNKLLEQIKIVGPTAILADERLLWAEIDGIDPIEYNKLLVKYQEKSDISKSNLFLPVGNNINRTEEGKKYLLELAKTNNIELNPNEPFIIYKTPQECPKGFFSERTYPNYLNPNVSKLTESLMAKDLSKFLNNKATVIDTRSENNQRPNTSTTARDAALELVMKIQKGNFDEQKEFHILFVTNNPYIERQTISTQREVDKVKGF